MATNEEILIAAYGGFNTRNLNAVLALMHDDVDWPNGMEGGRVQGHDGVREYWTRQWAMIDPHVEPMSFQTDKSGQTAVTVHQVVKSLEGSVLDDRLVEHTYLIEDGLIRRMDIGDHAA